MRKTSRGTEAVLDSVIAQVGERLRATRRKRGLSLEDLARHSGVSTGSLSQLERGIGNPSFATIARLAHALEMPVSLLVHEEVAHSPVVRRDSRPSLDLHGGLEAVGDAIHRSLTPPSSRVLEAIWIEAPPGYTTEAAPFSHPGTEFGLVLSGTHEVHLGDDAHVLHAGDSITYASTIPHWYRNLGDDDVTAVWVICPPAT